MSSPLYYQRFLDINKKAATVQVELSIIHPDVSDFGTDRLWAWKLLHDWVSAPDDDTDDDVILASRYVSAVKLSPLTNATVDKKASDYFTVKRATGKGKGKSATQKNPTVVYTIEVTDPALLADIKKGDGDEVYDFVEPGKGKGLTTPDKAKKKTAATAATAKKKAAASATETAEKKTYADVRDAALEGIKKVQGTWSDWIIDQGMLERWAREPAVRSDGTNKEVKRWLSYLQPIEQARGASLIAIDRLRPSASGSSGSSKESAAAAKDLAKLAESKYKAKDDYALHAISGLAPMWWLLGEKKKAEAGFKLVSDRLKGSEGHHDETIHLLLSMHARARRWDEVMKLVPNALEQSPSFAGDPIVPGAVLAWEENDKAFQAIMKKWSQTLEDGSSRCTPLSHEVFHSAIARERPELYVELLLAYPNVIEQWQMPDCALWRTEQKDPKLALSLAIKILAVGDEDDSDMSTDLQAQSIGILARHDAKKLDLLLKKEKAAWIKNETIVYLAAAGCTKEVVSILDKKKKGERRPSEDAAFVTSDRDLAVRVLKSACDFNSDPQGNLLVGLIDLGETEWVEKLLAKKLTAIEKQATKDRDLRCRYFAKAVAMIGRPDLGFAATKLPGNSVRRYTASDMAQGAASIGDFDTVISALALVPEGDANGRVSSTIQGGLRAADEASFYSPRAKSLAVKDDVYIQGLIAARDRSAIEWMQSAYGAKLSDDAQVAIDGFLEKS